MKAPAPAADGQGLLDGHRLCPLYVETGQANWWVLTLALLLADWEFVKDFA